MLSIDTIKKTAVLQRSLKGEHFIVRSPAVTWMAQGTSPEDAETQFLHATNAWFVEQMNEQITAKTGPGRPKKDNIEVHIQMPRDLVEELRKQQEEYDFTLGEVIQLWFRSFKILAQDFIPSEEFEKIRQEMQKPAVPA